MRTFSILALSSLLLAACNSDPEPTTTSGPDVPETSAAATTQPLVVGCPEEGQFVEGGLVSQVENPASDATTIGLISWQSDEACETFEVRFETSEGAPATTPPSITAQFVGDTGILRLATSARETVISDQLVETPLVERLYIVRSVDSGVFIDLHMAAPAQARVDLATSPARLRVQIQPGIVDYSGGPAIAGSVVLIAPADESPVPTSVVVEGYVRTFESNVLIIATQGDDVIVEMNVTATDSTDTWGEFRTDMELPPGPVELFVGEESAESGRFEGVSIDVEVR